jgi:hypothetical protein
VRQFRLANQSLVLLAQRDLEEFWRSLNTEGNPLIVKAALLDFFPELLTVYGDTAALLGADWYDELRNVAPSAASFRAVMASPPPTEQAQAAARWALGPLFTGEPDPVQVLANLAGSTQRLVLQAGRDTVWDSARRDSVRTAVARVPTGAKTCRWCTMLASRGAVYSSLASAGQENDYHDLCDCVPTVIRSDSDFPEGHDVKEFQRLYALGSGVGRDLPAD